ncbi:MAG: hypothetical protein H7256_08250 [Bdellovibrio sp.]|nr:hypothetical protein [Bdellovibrio sp.]
MKIISIILFLFCFQAKATTCAEWFAKIPLKATDLNCVSKCTTAKINMSSFGCTSECEKLCTVYIKDKNIPHLLASLYPGLNEEEKKIIAKYPKESFFGFLLKFKAESKSATLYPECGIDDEQDAARHFLWATLMRNELGMDMAKDILDAHEKTLGQTAASRAMDLANNRAGLLASDKLLKENKFSEENMVAELQDQIKNGNLSIIKPTQGKK